MAWRIQRPSEEFVYTSAGDKRYRIGDMKWSKQNKKRLRVEVKSNIVFLSF